MSKAYTNIEQSKKLAEILPIESADMGWYYSCNPQAARNQMWVGTKPENADVPCWSLAALFDILPKFIGDYGKCLYYDVGGYYCGYIDDGNFMLTIQETKADNPVDACYEMILKLHELNLL